MSILKSRQEPEKKVEMIVAEARAIQVTDADQAGLARDFDQRCKAMMAEIEGHHKPIIDSINNSLKQARAKRDELLEPLKKARDAVKASLTQWLVAEDRKRKQEQARIEQERLEKQKAMRKAAQDQIDAILADSRSLDAKIADLESQLADADDFTAGPIRAAIRALESSGEDNLQETMQLEMEAEASAVSEAVPQVEKVAGVVQRVDYQVDVTNSMALVRAVAAGDVPITCIKASQGELNKFARMTDGKPIPGCFINKQIKAHTRK